MAKGKIKSALCALLAAMIWGMAFVAQKVNALGAFTLCASRNIVAVLVLMLMILIMEKGNVKRIFSEEKKEDTKKLWIGGLICGVFLCTATCAQQIGINMGTEAGKAGFLTALYVVLIPVFGLFVKKKQKWTLWISVVLATAGMYLLSCKEGLSFRPSDLLVILCAVLFAFQVIFVGKYSGVCHALKLSCVQFLVSFVISGILAVSFEKIRIPEIVENIWPILYLGVFSSGIAYTLQIVAQKGENPAVISLILCLESVFSVLFAALLLGEVLAPREYIGCAMMFAAVILSEMPAVMRMRRKKNGSV